MNVVYGRVETSCKAKNLISLVQNHFSSVLPLLFVYLNGLLDFFNLSQKMLSSCEITEDYFEAD